MGLRVGGLAAVTAAALAGCGGGAVPNERGTHERPRAAAAGATRDRLTLPELGTLAVDCRHAAAYRLRLTADPDTATDRVVVRIGGRAVRRRWLDPGRRLAVTIPTSERRTGVDRVDLTPPVDVDVVQDSEPATIHARVRLVLEQSGDGVGSCTFVRASMVLTTTSHTAGP